MIAFSGPELGIVSVVNIGGRGLRALTRGDTPSWSPDGSRIAVYRPDDWALVVVRPDGSGEKRIGGSVWLGPPAAWSPDGGRLAFVERDFPFQLRVANADGTGIEVLVNDSAGRLTSPAWSPDGRRIAYVSEATVPTVDVVGAGGGKPRTLARNALGPAWSPDGRWLAFTPENTTQLFVVPAGGGRRRPVTHDPPTARIWGTAAWARDGRLLYSHLPGEDFELMTVRADGSEPRQLTHDFVGDREPAWSPDGTRVAFVREVAEEPNFTNDEIFVMRDDGSGVRRLTRHAREDSAPAWSPDGRRIVFARRLSRNSIGLAVMNADGSGVHVLVRHGFNEGPTWSPDGRRIAFAREVWFGDVPRKQLYVVNADGTGLRPLLPGDDHDQTDPDWAPDGGRILFVRHTPCGRNCDAPSLVTIRPDGAGEQTISPSGGFEQPSWSPDGRMLVALAGQVLHFLRADGTGVRSIPAVLAEKYDPAWQPLSRP
jgi:TolB protein